METMQEELILGGESVIIKAWVYGDWVSEFRLGRVRVRFEIEVQG